ncbi:hypothetical protein RIF29_37996 [Crotalaria pallida]|uniref:Ubiquitin-like protease family profile domain-containing protein n=1 Tax=Crotalaria pallida TaxID=3830 RepID=A0AAN9E0B8_CROPI
MSSDQVRDKGKGKGKGIANEIGIEKGLARKGGLIHDISITDERVGEEYNPDTLFPLSDADDVSLEINEKLSTPKPRKLQLTKQHQAQTLGIGKSEKIDDWNDVFGYNMMGINEVFLPDDITPIKGGSTTKKRGRPPGSASGKSKTPRPRFKSPIRTPSLASLDKPKGHIFPPGVRGIFKPKFEFDLTWTEMRMALYVFNKDLDPREILIKIGDESAKRRDFESLVPNNLIDEKIITLMCRKLTWIQAGAATITNWFLPPSFALAALNDRPLEEILDEYSKPWMPLAYPLKLIYVPLLEGNVYWYLMVIDFSNKKVYKMDIFDSPHCLERKHAAMKLVVRVCKVLEKVISSFDYAEEMWKTPTDFSAWEFKEVQGLPNLGTWLLEEDKTRMQTAVKLILGHYNELRATIEAETRNIWMSLPI